MCVCVCRPMCVCVCVGLCIIIMCFSGVSVYEQTTAKLKCRCVSNYSLQVPIKRLTAKNRLEKIILSAGTRSLAIQ